MMRKAWLKSTAKVAAAFVLTFATVQLYSSESSVVEAGAILPHFEDSFESGDLTHTSHGFEWTNSTNASVSTDIAHSGQNSLKFHYAGDPVVNPAASQEFELGVAQRNLWMEYWIYYPDGTEGLGSEYIHRLPSNGLNEQRVVEINGTEDNKMKMGIRSTTTSSLAANNENKFYPIWSNKTNGAQMSGQGANKLDPALTDDWRGRWVQFEMYFNVSESSDDSTLNLWVDGNLVMENTTLNAGHNTAEELFVRGSLLGQAIGGFAADTNVYIDDFKVYTMDPNEDPVHQHDPIASFRTLPKGNFLTGEEISFVDESIDVDGQVTGWSWNFGDSTGSSIQNPKHTYTEPGEYTVNLQVTDNESLSSIASTQVITVREDMGNNAGVLFFDDFETGDASHVVNGYGWKAGQVLGANGLNVEMSDDIAHTGDYSMRFKFVEKPRGCGSTPGCDDTAEQRFDFGEDQDEVWLSWYQYYPDGTEGVGPRWYHRVDTGGNNNKFLVIGPSPEDWTAGGMGEFGLFHIETEPVNDGDSEIMVKWKPDGSSEGEWGRFPINGGKTVSDDIRGRWVQNVFHLKAQSGWQQYDAVAEVWVDGLKIIDETNLNTWLFNGGPEDEVYNVISHFYMMGWSNSGFDETTYTYVDDFRLATTPPASIAQPPESSYTISPTSNVDTTTVVSFTDTSSDTDGSVVEWNWDFGDGTSSTVQNPSHTYGTADVYTVTLTVTDNDGLTSEPQEQILTVEPVVDFFTDGFETGDLSHANGNFEWGISTHAQVSGDKVRSGNYALKFQFLGDPTVAPNASQKFELSSGHQELWTEYWVYFPDGTEGVGPRYVHRYPGTNASEQAIFELDGPLNNQMRLGIRSATNSVLDGNNRYYPIWTRPDTGIKMSGQGADQMNPALTDDWRGQWVQFRMHYNLSDNNDDSTVQLWVDGVLEMDNITLNAGYPDGTQETLTSGLLFGKANSGFAEDTYVYIDDFKMFDTDPNWD